MRLEIFVLSLVFLVLLLAMRRRVLLVGSSDLSGVGLLCRRTKVGKADSVESKLYYSGK